MLTDTYISLFPTCLSFQSAFALLCSATCSHSSNQSLYLQRLRSRLSVGLLYIVHWMCSLVFHSIKISYVVLSRLEMLRVSGAFSVSYCRFQLVRFHEVSLDWFPLDHRLQVLFCIFLSSATTHDRLPCFLLLHKRLCLLSFCVWILPFSLWQYKLAILWKKVQNSSFFRAIGSLHLAIIAFFSEFWKNDCDFLTHNFDFLTIASLKKLNCEKCVEKYC